MTDASWSKGPPRKILLATDLSARCDRAMDRAAALAKAWQAELLAVHALEQTDDFYATHLEDLLPSWRRMPDAARVVEDQLRHDLMEASGRITAVVEKGEPVDVIVRVAEAQGADLIVTGIARDETLGRIGLGNTVHRLLRRTKVPLLIVKQRARSPYRHIVVATDFSESSRCALQAAMALFPEEKLKIFHAYDAPMAGFASDPKRFREQFRNWAITEYEAFLAASGIHDKHKQTFDFLAEEGHASRLLRQYVHDRMADLVVLGTHGQTGLLDRLIGSTAMEILSSLSCDALIVSRA